MTATPAPPRPAPRPQPAPAADPISEAELQRLLWDALSGTTVVLLGGANVVMQLARLPVGRGVAESRVESGRVDRHPIKRTRTTLAYLGVAQFGDERERKAYRDETNRSHRQVRSRPGDDVEYNAFDPELQRWVAACLYVGYEHAIRLAAPGFLDEHADAFYRYCARFGTTLQMPADLWPEDRAAFAEYWADGVAQIEFDQVTGDHLRDFVRVKFSREPWPELGGRLHAFIATGFLPKPFRDGLGLSWGPRRAGAHRRLIGAIMAVDRRLPGPVRKFPMNYFLWDTRRRMRKGIPIV